MVIAGWSDAGRGMPGDNCDVIGQTLFGWSLDDAMEGLAPRLERSRADWRWRQSANGWGQFQQARSATCSRGSGRAGTTGRVPGDQPVIGVTERPPGLYCPYTICRRWA